MATRQRLPRDADIEAARQGALGGDSLATLALCAAVPELMRQRDEYLAAIVYVLENRDADGDHDPLSAVEELRERYRWPWPHGHAKVSE